MADIRVYQLNPRTKNQIVATHKIPISSSAELEDYNITAPEFADALAENLIPGVTHGGFAMMNNWSPPKGGLILDGTDDKVTISNNAKYYPGTDDFSVAIWFKQTKASTSSYLPSSIQFYDNNSSGWRLNHYNGQWQFLIKAGTNYINISKPEVLNEKVFLAYTVDRTNNLLKRYYNGNYEAQSDISTVTGSLNPTSGTNLLLGTEGTFYLEGEEYAAFLFNKVLIDDEVLKLYNNGNPNGSTIPYKYRGASQTALTSGTLTIGLEYTIDTYVTGDDFTNVGAASNASGVVFTATGTTPTTWTNSSSLRHTGNTLELKGENMGSNGVIDTSGNGLHGETSGSPIAKDFVYDYGEVADASTTKAMTNSCQASKSIEKILIYNTGTATPTVNVGTSAAATDIVNAKAIAASGWTEIRATDLLKTFFSESADQDIHFTFSVAPGSSYKYKIKIKYED